MKSKNKLKKLILNHPYLVWIFWLILYTLFSCIVFSLFGTIITAYTDYLGIKSELIFYLIYLVGYSIIHYLYIRYLDKHNVSIDPTEGDLSSIYRERIDYSLDSSKSEDFKENTDKNNN